MGGWESEVIVTMDIAFLAVVCIKERWKKLSSASQHLQMITAVANKAEDRLFIRTRMLLAGAPESENLTFAITQSTCRFTVWSRVHVQDKIISIKKILGSGESSAPS